MYRQLSTPAALVPAGDPVEDTTIDLTDTGQILEPPATRSSNAAEAILRLSNGGSASAYLITAGDAAAPTRPLTEIPADGEVYEYGPFEWPEHVPRLHLLVGASVVVTAFVRGAP